MSEYEEASVSLMSYVGRQLEHRVTRRQFNGWISPRVTRAVDFLKATIRKAGLSVEALDEVVVTGGSSRLPLVRERLADEFPPTEFSAEPEWDVAHGAAILQQNPGSYEMAESIGLVLSDGWFHPLLTEGSRPDNQLRTVSLALVEDAREANLVLARRRPGESGASEAVLSMNVPALGFDRERIDLSHKLSEDLVLELEARGDALARRAKGCFHGVRFTYRVGTDGGEV